MLNALLMLVENMFVIQFEFLLHSFSIAEESGDSVSDIFIVSNPNETAGIEYVQRKKEVGLFGIQESKIDQMEGNGTFKRILFKLYDKQWDWF